MILNVNTIVTLQMDRILREPLNSVFRHSHAGWKRYSGSWRAPAATRHQVGDPARPARAEEGHDGGGAAAAAATRTSRYPAGRPRDWG